MCRRTSDSREGVVISHSSGGFFHGHARNGVQGDDVAVTSYSTALNTTTISLGLPSDWIVVCATNCANSHVIVNGLVSEARLVFCFLTEIRAVSCYFVIAH